MGGDQEGGTGQEGIKDRGREEGLDRDDRILAVPVGVGAGEEERAVVEAEDGNRNEGKAKPELVNIENMTPLSQPLIDVEPGQTHQDGQDHVNHWLIGRDLIRILVMVLGLPSCNKQKEGVRRVKVRIQSLALCQQQGGRKGGVTNVVPKAGNGDWGEVDAKVEDGVHEEAVDPPRGLPLKGSIGKSE